MLFARVSDINSSKTNVRLSTSLFSLLEDVGKKMSHFTEFLLLCNHLLNEIDETVEFDALLLLFSQGVMWLAC